MLENYGFKLENISDKPTLLSTLVHNYQTSNMIVSAAKQQ